MADVMEEDILTNIYNQLSSAPIVSLQQQGEHALSREDILDTEYAIWF